jgi:SAM-dependent methyltransferase
MAFVKEWPRKAGGTTNLFYCMECESFSSPQSPPNPETDQTAWHISVLERNLGWCSTLLDLLRDAGAKGPIVDVGCGIGSLLLAAKTKRMTGVGFDLDGYATAYGRKEFGLDLRSELWTKDKVENFGLLTCISVLEHIHQPRPVVREMMEAAKERKASVYLSVPFVDRNAWNQLRTDNLATPGHLFALPHVHVTHFSHKGMEMLCREVGAVDYQRIDMQRAWYGVLVKF